MRLDSIGDVSVIDERAWHFWVGSVPYKFVGGPLTSTLTNIPSQRVCMHRMERFNLNVEAPKESKKESLEEDCQLGVMKLF